MLIKSISLKIFLSTSVLILVGISIISIILFNQYSESLMEQSSEKAQQVIELSAMNIETYLDELYRLSLSPYYNQDVIEALDKNIKDTDINTLYRTRTVEDFLEQMLIIPRQDILRVFIFTDEIFKGERMTSSIDSNQDYTKYKWYKEAIETGEPLLVSAHVEQIIKNPQNIVFSIVRTIKSTLNTDRVLGVIKVDANYTTIIDICDKIDFGDNGGVVIIDSDKQIIYSNVPNINLSNLNIDSQNHQKTYNFEGNDYLLNITKIKGSDWTMVGMTSIDTINQKILTVRTTAILTSVICSFLSIIIIYIYLNRFLLPLNRITKTIKQIQKGNLDVTFKVASNDELGDLADSLNNMVYELNNMFEENDKLAHQIYRSQYLQKEAQINFLFSQIQPHFIYNTLNMISIQIQSNSIDDAIRNINQLSIMLRGLSHLDKDIRIASEIEFLKAYLEIQKNRYLDRLDYSIDIDPEILDYIIPALSLQPIVENSVIHGCELKKELTTIKIYNKISKNSLILIVEDDGTGMNKTKLDNLNAKLTNNENLVEDLNPHDKSSGIGLVNVNLRLQIKYGKEYGISVSRKKNNGTKVLIKLPKIT